jgi:hypothetical protein
MVIVSIHSEDRNILKYPSSSEFSINLPNDITNIKSVRLVDCAFPSNYNTFSKTLNNTVIKFILNNPFNPQGTSMFNRFAEAVYIALFYNNNYEYTIEISEGFYNPDQMCNELTNKFNEAITKQILEFFNENKENTKFKDFNFENAIQFKKQNYNDFVFKYDEVKQKIMIGNRKDGFIIKNSSLFDNDYLQNKQYNEFINWGLSSHLGLTLTDDESTKQLDLLPRFYHIEGEGGYWLPSYGDDIKVHFIEPKEKINLFGPAYFYLECTGLNYIDETSPYVMNDYTITNNLTNGRVRSAFAKIPIPSTPISQYFESNSNNCVAIDERSRLSKLNFKLRYHNGELVSFGRFEYSFTLEFK